LTSKQINNQAI